MQHPHHNLLTQTVRQWHEKSYPEIGIETERRKFGFYRNSGEVDIRDLPVSDVEEFFSDLEKYYGDVPTSLKIGDQALNERLKPIFLQNGWEMTGIVRYLAHVGDLPEMVDIDGYSNEEVNEENLYAAALTRLMGFANSEDDPVKESFHAEYLKRKQELDWIAKGVLARINKIPAGMIWWNQGEDLFIYLLATRVPFRGRGVAFNLINHVLQQGSLKNSRSVMINVMAENENALKLFNSIGFTNEVYRRYEYNKQNSEPL